MHNVMNRYLNKITPAGLLRSPPNEGTMGGSQGGSNGGGNDSSNANGSDSGNSSADDGDGTGSGSADEDDDDLLSAADDSEEIKLDEESDDDFELTDEQKAAGETLKTQILGAIDSFKMDELPDDFDPTDKKQLSDFLGNQQKKAMRSTIAMIPGIINHALGVTMAQMEKKLGSAVDSKSRKSEAVQTFNDMGFSGQDRVVAKSLYERALQKKMTPKDARKATERAMKSLGLSSGKSQSRGEMSSKKEGADALAGFFGN